MPEACTRIPYLRRRRTTDPEGGPTGLQGLDATPVWRRLFLRACCGPMFQKPWICSTWNTANPPAMFQKPPKMFHLEHMREGGALMKTAVSEVDLHRVRLMALLNELVRGARSAGSSGGPRG